MKKKKNNDKLSDFEVLRILGSSDTNPISKVRCLKNNKIYSMKKIDLNAIPNEEEKKLIEEQMQKLKSLNHPHLLKYYKTFKDENEKNLYLIYEYMNNSDLNSLIKAHIILQKPVKEETIWNILLQCLSGLSHLHSESVKSLSIKPTNIYLNNEQNTKISLFFKPAALQDKNYDIQNDIYFIGQYFYKICFLLDQPDDKWITDIVVKDQPNPNNYSKELMDIIYMMSTLSPQKYNASQLYEKVKLEYVKKFTKVTSIDALLRCLYSFPDFNNAINQRSQYIKNNQEKCYISYWFLKSIEAIKENRNLKECYEEFRRALASANSKIDCSKEVNPVFLFVFLLEKMHKELNKKKTTIVQNSNFNDQYVINSIYRMEEKEDKTNKPEILNKFTIYTKENINSEISNLFYGITKLKKNCKQCKNGFYSFSHMFCAAFNLEQDNVNSYFNLEQAFKNEFKETKYICEICLTEQEFSEFDDYYQMAQHLVICFYRGSNYSNERKIMFNQNLEVIENKGLKNKVYVKINVFFELIGALIRVINNGEENFIYYCRDLNNHNRWYSKNGIVSENGCPLDQIQNVGQIIMLFYNKFLSQSNC